jgi:hypothetical protein
MERSKSSLFLKLSPGPVISCAGTNNGETITKIRYGSVLVDAPALHVPYAYHDGIKIGNDAIPIATFAAPWNAAAVCNSDKVLKFDRNSLSPTPTESSHHNHPSQTTRGYLMDAMDVIPMVDVQSSCKNCRESNEVYRLLCLKLMEALPFPGSSGKFVTANVANGFSIARAFGLFRLTGANIG